MYFTTFIVILVLPQVIHLILSTFHRAAQPKTDPNDCKLIFEKGKAIEHEFAGYFTGMLHDNINKSYSWCTYIFYWSMMLWSIHPLNDTLGLCCTWGVCKLTAQLGMIV